MGMPIPARNVGGTRNGMDIVFEELSPGEFVRRRGNAELWQLVDVREPWETEIASIDDAIRMPMGTVPARHPELDKRRPVAVLCHSGGRSARVAGYLASQGFARVANISGGIDAWSLEVDATVPRY